MPYAEPTSPTSPLSERPHYRRHSHNGSRDFRPAVTAPMPNLPRRASASSSTPRRGTFHNAPRTAANSVHTDAVEAMRAVESLRSPPSKAKDYGVLGIKLQDMPPPPQLPHLTHESHSSDSSTSVETPEHRHVPLPSANSSSLMQRHKRLSSSSLPSPAVDPPPRHPSERMVRKKSGEVVKSSLKQRSLSTPDLSRGGKDDQVSGKSKSSHNLRERTKSVRFDDVELESVVRFVRTARPMAVSKAADGRDNQDEVESDNDGDLSDYVHFRTRRNGGPRRNGNNNNNNGDDDREIVIDTCSSVPRVRLDFGPGTHGLLDNENVVLERLEMSPPLDLRGSILVRNICFEKWVTVRFSLDDWQMVSDIAAQHASHVPAGTTGDEGWDRFTFNIKLEDYRRKLEDRSLRLCVRYNAEGKEWWDSNGGDNYTVTFKAQAPRRQRNNPSLFFSGSLTHPSTDSALSVTRRSAPQGPRNWVFPRSASAAQPQLPRISPPRQQQPRPESPALSPPPETAYRPPSAPDVHTHLRLNKYCAPSPPQSPPKRLSPAAGLSPIVLPLAPVRAPPMTMVHGRPATQYIPDALQLKTDDDVFTPTSDEASDIEFDCSNSNDDDDDKGDVTPVGARARSPETNHPSAGIFPGAIFTDSPSTSPTRSSSQSQSQSQSQVDRATPIPRSTSTSADLNSLSSVDSSVGLMTPPSSNNSSPPISNALLPPESPMADMSTGDSSPVNTLNSATPDEGMDVSLDNAIRGRTLNAASYQEFLDKFCFFKSPPANTMPLAEPGPGSYFPPMGYATGTGFYGGDGFNQLGSTTPPGAVTPTFNDYALARAATPTNYSVASASGSTPRASPSLSPVVSTYPLPWTPGEDTTNAPTPPSLAAA